MRVFSWFLIHMVGLSTHLKNLEEIKRLVAPMEQPFEQNYETISVKMTLSFVFYETYIKIA